MLKRWFTATQVPAWAWLLWHLSTSLFLAALVSFVALSAILQAQTLQVTREQARRQAAVENQLQVMSAQSRAAACLSSELMSQLSGYPAGEIYFFFTQRDPSECVSPPVTRPG